MSVFFSNINNNSHNQIVEGLGSFFKETIGYKNVPNSMDLYHHPAKQSKISTIKKNLKYHISTIFFFRENHK